MHLSQTYETNYNYGKKEKFLIIEETYLYVESMNRKLFKYAQKVSTLEITKYYYAPSLQGTFSIISCRVERKDTNMLI